jgi:hypothetical protein
LTNGGIVGSRFAVVEVEQTPQELYWNQAAERIEYTDLVFRDINIGKGHLQGESLSFKPGPRLY